MKIKAVTMVDTLVVVVTLTVAVAAAIPTLAGIGFVNKQQRCLQNLRTIGHANLIYSATDSTEAAIPIHRDFKTPIPLYIGAYEWGGKSGIGDPGHVGGVTGELSSRYGTAAGVGPATRPLNRVLFGELPDYTSNPGPDNQNWENDTNLALNEVHCPSDTGPPRGAHCPEWRSNETRSSYDHFGTSYSANIMMTASGGGGEMFSNSPYLRPTSTVPNPARTLAYQENNGRWAWAVRESPDCTWIGEGVYPDGTIRGWHGKDWTFAATFIDGHADMIYMNGHVSTRVLDELQEQYRCIIVRGYGWQKDTLPAPRIPTGFQHDGHGRPSYNACVEIR